ncbi:MAG TPA: hypothetical protein VE197_12705 [Mycobacterium sp.]|nr:hypothetical protein [Mycobacterium sp.]
MRQRGALRSRRFEAYTGKMLRELMSWVDRAVTETAFATCSAKIT